MDPNDHFIRIYNNSADAYHRMIAVEDVDGHLLPALEAVGPLAGKRTLDLGSGTGRLPLLLHAQAGPLLALDLHAPMLHEQARWRGAVGGHWHLSQADYRQLPVPSGWAEVVTAGWSIGHLQGWYPDDWQQQVDRVLREMHRVLAPGGIMVIIETLGTGALVAAPPHAGLAGYYAWIEGVWGLSRQTISTDYQFASVDEAVEYSAFFFGEEMAAAVRKNAWARLPEWTGVWGKRV